MELLILVEILSYFNNLDADQGLDESFMEKIFSAYKTLGGNPALAKYILQDAVMK